MLMPPEPVPDDPGRDGDPGWPGPDPMTAAEREAWLDRLCQSGDPPEEEDEEDWDVEPLTAEEFAGVRAAAADELLAAEAAMTGRRGPGRTLSWPKAAIIMRATLFLDPAEAAAAEAKVLGRAARLTPPSLRAAIARAVMQVAPGKARTRREQAARDARVERWAEDSGNAALTGRELPPAEVLAADERITRKRRSGAAPTE